MATSIPPYASIMILVNRASKDMVGDDASSFGMQHLCGLISEHVVPFNLTHLKKLSLLHVVPPFL